MYVKTDSTLLLKNSLFNIVYKVLNLLFPLITTMYVSRVLLPSGVGMVAYAQNITSYFISISTLGIYTYGVREIAKVRDSESKSNQFFTELISITWIGTILLSAAFLLFVWVNRSRIDYKLFLCCGIQLFLNVINIDWFYGGIEQYSYIVVRSVLIKLLSIVALFLFVQGPDDYIVYALITSVALGGNYFFNVIHARKFVRLQFAGWDIKKHLKPLFIMGTASFLGTIYTRIDITMLGLMNTADEVGLYSNAFKLVEIVITLAIAVTSVFLPRLSYYFQESKNDFFKTLILGFQALSFFVFPMIVGLVLEAPHCIPLVFGKDFAGSVPIVQILSALIFIKGFGDLLCFQLAIATGNEKKRLPAYALAAVLNVILNAFLIPIMGGIGAAIASVISEFILNIHQFFTLKKILQYKLSWKPIFQNLCCSILMIIPVQFLLSLKINRVLACVVSVIAGVLVYLITSYIFKNVFMLKIVNKMKCIVHKH